MYKAGLMHNAPGCPPVTIKIFSKTIRAPRQWPMHQMSANPLRTRIAFGDFSHRPITPPIIVHD